MELYRIWNEANAAYGNIFEIVKKLGLTIRKEKSQSVIKTNVRGSKKTRRKVWTTGSGIKCLWPSPKDNSVFVYLCQEKEPLSAHKHATWRGLRRLA